MEDQKGQILLTTELSSVVSLITVIFDDLIQDDYCLELSIKKKHIKPIREF